MAKWFKSENFPGIRYRKHPTRKNGVKMDQYFTIRYKIPYKNKETGIILSKDREEGLGWSSEGWSEKKAYDSLNEIRGNIKAGKGPQTLKEKRDLERERREQQEAEQKKIEKETLSFEEIFKEHYFPVAKQNKTKGAWQAESALYNLWVGPVIGNLPLKDISPILLERIKKNMLDEGKAPRSINYALSLIRQVYNFSKSNGMYSGDWPGTGNAVKMVKKDNRRQRFLTHREADVLLSALQEKSRDVHDMALLSLHCGLRAGEIFSLTWADVNMDKDHLSIRDTKSGRNRHAYMTDAVKKMLYDRGQGPLSELVFPARNGKQVDRISKTFHRVVNDLGLNNSITDPRQKVVFHSLRHSFASWLVESGVSLYVVQKLLGQENISQTAIYSHLSPDTLQDAVRTLQKTIEQTSKRQAGQVVNLTE